MELRCLFATAVPFYGTKHSSLVRTAVYRGPALSGCAGLESLGPSISNVCAHLGLHGMRVLCRIQHRFLMVK